MSKSKEDYLKAEAVTLKRAMLGIKEDGNPPDCSYKSHDGYLLIDPEEYISSMVSRLKKNCKASESDWKWFTEKLLTARRYQSPEIFPFVMAEIFYAFSLKIEGK